MILGKHTVNEARDYLAVADYRFKETKRRYDLIKNKPVDLINDVGILYPKWANDREDIASDLRNKVWMYWQLSPDQINAEDEFNRIKNYIQYQELNPKSLQGITIRIDKLLGNTTLYPDQPRQDSKDVDQELFLELDNTIKQGEAAAKSVKSGIIDAATSPTGLILIGAVGVVVAAKIYFR